MIEESARELTSIFKAETSQVLCQACHEVIADDEYHKSPRRWIFMIQGEVKRSLIFPVNIFKVFCTTTIVSRAVKIVHGNK